MSQTSASYSGLLDLRLAGAALVTGAASGIGALRARRQPSSVRRWC